MTANAKNQIAFNQYLDAKGLDCPLPILKTKLLLNKMHTDEILFVEATDPHSEVDFEAYCARSKHAIVKSTNNNGIYGFYIKRASQPNKV